MEMLIALLVALGIVTSEDSNNGRFSSEEIKIMAEQEGLTDEKIADYAKEQAKKNEEEHEAASVIIDVDDF